MNRAQGNTRSDPDGFLHIQNFTVTKASGTAGIVWKLLDAHQRGIVESILIERACALEESAGPEWTHAAHHFKHNTWRFRKSFLKSHFSLVVVETCKVCKINPLVILNDRLLDIGVVTPIGSFD